MNFNIDMGDWIMKLVEKYETSNKVRLLVWLVLIILFLFAAGAFLQGLGAIRWW